MIYCINLLVWDLKNCSHESQEISSAFYDNGILKATEGHRTYTKWPLKQWPKLETYASRRLPIGFEVVRLFGCSLPYKSVTHWLHMLMTAYIYIYRYTNTNMYTWMQYILMSATQKQGYYWLLASNLRYIWFK